MGSAIGSSGSGQGGTTYPNANRLNIRDFGAIPGDTTKASINVAAIQAAFDAAEAVASDARIMEVVIPSDGVYYLNAPVFAPPNYTLIRGEGDAGSRLSTTYGVATPLLVTGMPHLGSTTNPWVDLYQVMDTSVAPAAGQAYGLDVSKRVLRFRGTPFDLGPLTSGQPNLWYGMQQFTIATAIRPNAGWNQFGIIFGTEPNNVRDPYPISLCTSPGLITLSLRTSDLRVHTIKIPATFVDNQVLKLIVMVDLINGRATAYINGLAVAVTIIYDQGWGSGGNLHLAPPEWGESCSGGGSFVLCGLKLYSELVYTMDVAPGTSLGSYNDSIYGKFGSGTNEFAALNPATSATANSQPWQSRSGGVPTSGFAFITRPGGDRPSPPPSNLTVQNLSFYSWGANGYGCGILHNTVWYFRIENCRFLYGGIGFAALQAYTSYPVEFQQIEIVGATYAGIIIGFGIWNFERINFGTVGRYAISAWSGFTMKNFFTGEGASTEAVIRFWAKSAETDSVILENGIIDYESVSAKYMVRHSQNKGGNPSFLMIRNVVFTRVQSGSVAIKIDSSPYTPLTSTGVPTAIVNVTLRDNAGIYLQGGPTATVGVDSGGSCRVLYETGYPLGFVLAKNLNDTTQGTTWSGFSPGLVPTAADDSTPRGGLMTIRPTLPQPSAGFDLQAVPGLRGYYRADFQGNDSDALASLLDDIGGSGRAALDLAAVSGTPATLMTDANNELFMRFSPGGVGTNCYRDDTSYNDTTLGVTIVYVIRQTSTNNQPFGVFRSKSPGAIYGIGIDAQVNLSTVDSNLDAASTNFNDYAVTTGLMVAAVSFDRTTGDFSRWYNGRRSNIRQIRDTASLANYATNKFLIGGSSYSDKGADLYAVLVFEGSLSDRNMQDVAYSLMNRYTIYG